MMAKQVLIVKRTWKPFRYVSSEIVGDAFYIKLFADKPTLRKMFPSNMEVQDQKLIDMLNAIVMRLDKLDELTEEITAMAQRHADYCVRPAHYKLVGTALIWTLQQGLGHDWNEKVYDAWAACYTILAETMIGAAYLKQ